MDEALSRVRGHPLIEVSTDTRPVEFQGTAGRFTTVLQKDETLEALEHGAVILATGAREWQTRSYGYGSREAVVTQSELEARLARNALDFDRLETVVMIQCVDSREEPRNFCSRVCCAAALGNALRLKESRPDLAVYVFYRDIMAYGLLERDYTRARRAGIVFIRYDAENKPEAVVDDQGRLRVSGTDPVLGRPVEIQADLLVLSTGFDPEEGRETAEIFGVRTDEDGFFLEADPKWRPLDSTREGVFICGLAHSPRSMVECAAMGEAAAQRASRLLHGEIPVFSSLTASVDERLCTGCKTCVEMCAYGAVAFSEERKAACVNALLCQGCGNCASACPVAAIGVKHCSQEEMFPRIEGLLEGSAHDGP